MNFENMSSADLGDFLEVTRKPVTKQIELSEEEKNELVLLRKELNSKVHRYNFCSIPRREITAVDGLITADMVGGKIVDYGPDYKTNFVVRLPPTEDDLQRIEYKNKLEVRIQELKDKIKELNKKPKQVIDKEATEERKKLAETIIGILQSRKKQK